VVALDASDRPSFNTLQNQGAAKVPVYYYVFDLLMLAGRDMTTESLAVRRKLFQTDVLPRLSEPIRCSPQFNVGLNDLIQSVRAQGLEGVWQSAWTAYTNPASAPEHGRRCGSTAGKNS
jgi:ATP-dependent DNA ligase